MYEASSQEAWVLRPNLVTTRIPGFAAAMFCVLLGWVPYLATDHVRWWVVLFLLSFWAGLKGCPLLLRSLEWRADLSVEVDAIRDREDRPLTGDARVTFRHADDVVRLGCVLGVDLDEVEEAP
ncbi:MAG: hypothetical protein ACYTG6_06070 [Planctomycetota bacterium]|jgi:hypothetical protein